MRGSGTLRLDGEELEVREGLAVRVDPAVRRQPIAGDDGLAWVAIGAPRDGRYEPPALGLPSAAPGTIECRSRTSQ